MFLEIITPEAVVFSSKVVSVTVPGFDGNFQMLNNHAPIISILEKGAVKIEANSPEIHENFEDKFLKTKDGKLVFEIESGTIEMKNNKIIILAD